jgi:integrase/recombinase XerD
MLKQGNRITTISIYLRTLRALFNNLLSYGLLTKIIYPFGKKKYEIPTGNNIKKSLTLKDIAAIYYYKPIKGINAEMSKDYWLFMYLCNGINVKDMCLLKYENIKGDILEFERAKTARTKRKVEPIRVALVDDAKQIIKRWGNRHLDGNTYIFPVLTKGLSAVRKRQLIQQLTGVINDHMRVIAKDLAIESNLTTYVARHSFSTILQRSGASTEFISEALGHSNVKTTQNYLAGFEDESKKETVKALTAFKNNLQAVG